MSGGGGAARSDFKLPRDQIKLFQAVMALDKTVAVVTMSGRPLELCEVAERATAIRHGWYGGTRGGAAIARALFGDVNSGGKLPITWPRSVGQVPIYYAHNTMHAARSRASAIETFPPPRNSNSAMA